MRLFKLFERKALLFPLPDGTENPLLYSTVEHFGGEGSTSSEVECPFLAM
jgi:hypothetical protein